jgi:carboxypeptidase C (cathepsin A)
LPHLVGESYAGHYVPQLALQVVYGNSIGKAHIPLRGILAGNPSFDFPTDANSYIPFMAQHALISESEFATINATCKGVFYNNQNQDCNKMVADVSNRNFGYINPYNIIG